MQADAMFVRFQFDETKDKSSNALEDDERDDEAEEDVFDFSQNETEFPDENRNHSDSKMSLAELRRSHPEVLDARNSSVIRKTKVMFENSYRIEPCVGEFFVWYKVRNIINLLVGPLFGNFNYESKAAAALCKLLCNKIVTVVKKKLDYPRYRYVCQAILVQLSKQGLMIADRSLWFPQFDNCASATFVKKKAVMVITFHAIYQD